jgi:hypothetical protein
MVCRSLLECTYARRDGRGGTTSAGAAGMPNGAAAGEHLADRRSQLDDVPRHFFVCMHATRELVVGKS